MAANAAAHPCPLTCTHDRARSEQRTRGGDVVKEAKQRLAAKRMQTAGAHSTAVRARVTGDTVRSHRRGT